MISLIDQNKVRNLYPDTEFKESATLTKLKALTEILAPPLTAFVKYIDHNVSEYDMVAGTATTFNLYRDESIAVARIFASAESKFPLHSHDQREFAIVYTGCMILDINGKKKTIHTGESTYINAGIEHSAYFPEDTWILAVTVPPAPGYPGEEDGEDNES
jgi:quercetin dioxygenase-like cupin family protein